jgi:hypothetical protein
MKIDRESRPPIIVGKRVTFGGIIGGIVATGAFVWDTMNPENPLPAPVVLSVTVALTGLVQIWLVNKYGVTTNDG